MYKKKKLINKIYFYAVSIAEDNMKTEANTEFNIPSLLQPIFITSPINYVNLCNNLK